MFATSLHGVPLHAEQFAGVAANALEAVTAGSGRAVSATVTSSTNTLPCVLGSHHGDGPGVRGDSTNGVGGLFSGGRAAINLVPRSTAGRPTSGAHSRGDLVVDNTGKMFLCTAGGTPGTWVRINVIAA